MPKSHFPLFFRRFAAVACAVGFTCSSAVGLSANHLDYADLIKRSKAGGYGQTMRVSLGKYASSDAHPSDLADDLQVKVIGAPPGLRYHLDQERNTLTVYYSPAFKEQTFKVQLMAMLHGLQSPGEVQFTWQAGEDEATYQAKQALAAAYFPQVSDALWYDPAWLSALDHSDGVVLYKAEPVTRGDVQSYVGGQRWTASRAHQNYVQAHINRISACLLSYSQVSPTFQTQKWFVHTADAETQQNNPDYHQYVLNKLAGKAFAKEAESTGWSHHPFSYTRVFVNGEQLDQAVTQLLDHVRSTLKPQVAGYFEPRFFGCI